jgi:CHASE2 domain-containing sensor protein/serine phosphatase RsbU (regulator of sigma subunit)
VVALRELAVDGEQRLRPRVRESAPVTIVEIDERALAEHGQWPWPRSRLAALVDRIAQAGPAAIGLDLLFPEPDRYSPAALAGLLPQLPDDVSRRLRRLPGNDDLFARSLRRAPTVLAVAGVGDAAPTSEPPILHYESRLSSIPGLVRAAAGQGLISAGSLTRVVRRVPAVARVQGSVVPTLGLEMLRVAIGAPPVGLSSRPGGLLEIGIGELRIPAQGDGTLWLRYSPHDPQRFVSAAAVLEGSVDPALLRSKLVLVGVTGLALVDHVATPLGERVPGVETHAQLIEQVFDRVRMVRPGWARLLEAGMLAAAGGLLLFVVPARRVRVSVGALLLLLAAIAIAAFAAFSQGILIDYAWPAIGVALVFALLLAATLSEADRQRRALREAAARAAGELAAARRIQMGLLPDLGSLSRSLPALEVAGFVEPARTVGGDFYDCVPIDASRVYFVVGDVAGKGMPAALFMALSKAVLKSAAARRLDAGALLTEAAAEIDRDNPEQLFVTAFAGILDLSSGELEYANAGHEPPYLLSRGEAPRRLPHAGGPPLCTIAGYRYGTERLRLPPGACLCVVTDGITEALDERGELYGALRLEEVLKGLAAESSPGAVLEALRGDVRRFVGNAPLADDVTLVALRWGRAT